MPTQDKLYEELGRAQTRAADSLSNSVTRRWLLIRASTAGEIPSPDSIGLPAIGSTHASLSTLKLAKYEVSEDRSTGAVTYEATYAAPASSEKQDGEGNQIRIESRGWRGTSYEAPAVYDVLTGSAIVLPTGEPFESVPNTSRAAATFHVTFLSKKKSGAIDSNCTLNKSAITIDGVSIPPRCGRLTASEEELLDSQSDYTYRVSIEVDIRHNLVSLSPGATPVDIGHDFALLLQGYKYFGTIVNRYGEEKDALVPFLESDGQGGTKPATTPGFLTADGHRLENPSPTNCHFLRVHAIAESDWSASWFK